MISIHKHTRKMKKVKHLGKHTYKVMNKKFIKYFHRTNTNIYHYFIKVKKIRLQNALKFQLMKLEVY